MQILFAVNYRMQQIGPTLAVYLLEYLTIHDQLDAAKSKMASEHLSAPEIVVAINAMLLKPHAQILSVVTTRSGTRSISSG
jgi:hypothetical protein